jgi:hypothetical protein
VAVEDARRDHEADIAELRQFLSQSIAQADRRVSEQAAAGQPDDGHPPAHLEAEIPQRLFPDQSSHAIFRSIRLYPTMTRPDPVEQLAVEWKEPDLADPPMADVDAVDADGLPGDLLTVQHCRSLHELRHCVAFGDHLTGSHAHRGVGKEAASLEVIDHLPDAAVMSSDRTPARHMPDPGTMCLSASFTSAIGSRPASR